MCSISGRSTALNRISSRAAFSSYWSSSRSKVSYHLRHVLQSPAGSSSMAWHTSSYFPIDPLGASTADTMNPESSTADTRVQRSHARRARRKVTLRLNVPNVVCRLQRSNKTMESSASSSTNSKTTPGRFQRLVYRFSDNSGSSALVPAATWQSYVATLACWRCRRTTLIASHIDMAWTPESASGVSRICVMQILIHHEKVSLVCHSVCPWTFLQSCHVVFDVQWKLLS